MRLILITRVIDLRAISGYRDRRRQLAMAEQYLSCNVRNCGVKLKEKAYVTSCSHTFCVDHGQRAIQNNVSPECIICGTKLDKLYDFMLIDLNPSDQYKSVRFAQKSPDPSCPEQTQILIIDDAHRLASGCCARNRV